jgi:Cu2+-containing amine oxidase
LNENFTFTRPLTITGAYLLPTRFIDGNFVPKEVFFHQMVLDRVDDSTNEYVIHNTSFNEGGPVLRIPKKNAYYISNPNMMNLNAAGQYKLKGQNGEEWTLVNENVKNTMKPKTWYLLPQAYLLTLVPEQTAVVQVKIFFVCIDFKTVKQMQKLSTSGP